MDSPRQFSGTVPLLTGALVAAAALLAAPPASSQSADSAPPPKRRYVVAAIGDSITDTRVGGGKYMSGLAKRCPRSRFDAYGVGGQQTRHMRWRFTQELFGDGIPNAQKPGYTHVILLGGVNDLSGGVADEARVEKSREHLRFMYKTGRERGVSVIALTVPPFGHLGGGGNHGPATESLNTWIKGAAVRGEVDRVVDIHPGLACGPQQVLCEPYRRFGKDMVHWNEAGHEVVAETLFTSVFADCE